jgi:hypothetical protein
MSRNLFVLFAIVLAVASGPMPPVAHAETPRERVGRSFAELDDWLATSRHGAAWRKYLRSDELQFELTGGGAANPETVGGILAQYAASKPGLEKPRFTAVRRALEAWLEEIAAPPPHALAETAQNVAGSFSPPSTEEVQQRRDQLTAAAANLDRFLAGGGEQKEQGWKRHLLWSEMLEQLRDDASPDARVLRSAELKYFGLHRGLELAVFDAVRQRLRAYTNALIVSDPRAKKLYEDQIAALVGHLEAVAVSVSNEQMLAIGRILGTLEMAGQAESLVDLARSRLSRPNLHVEVSEKLLAAGMNENFRTRQRIHETILGTEIHGYPDTRARVSVDLVPDEQQASFDFRIDGTAVSDNVGYNGPVTIYSSSRTTINGSKRILLDAEGFHTRPALARCTTTGVIHDIAAQFLIVENIAWRAASRQKASAEALGNQRTEARVREQIDLQAEIIVEKLNEMFLERIRLPLLRKDHYPRSLRFATSEDRLLATVLQAGAFQLGAATAPPPLEDGLDLSLRVHDSLVGNFAEGVIGGETLTDARLAQMLKNLTGEVPEELLLGPDKDPWSIKFAGSQPVTVRFDDQQIRIVVTGSEFTRGPQIIKEPIAIAATYYVEKTPLGARLVRQGEVDVEFLARRSLGVTHVAFKAFMQTKFGALFKPEIVGRGLEIVGRSKQVTRLHVRQLSCDDGWAVFGWDAAPAPLTAQRPTSGER